MARNQTTKKIIPTIFICKNDKGRTTHTTKRKGTKSSRIPSRGTMGKEKEKRRSRRGRGAPTQKNGQNKTSQKR